MLARALPDVPRDLPESVRSMIARKIEQVDERDRALLLAASVQGHEFDSAIVAEAVGDRSRRASKSASTMLERVHVFVKRGDEQEFPDRTLTLHVPVRARALSEHALCVAPADAARGAERTVSQSAAVATTARPPPTSASRLAVLFEAARDFAASAQYFFVAAQHAVGPVAFREALSLAERGLGASRRCPTGRRASSRSSACR